LRLRMEGVQFAGKRVNMKVNGYERRAGE